MSPTFSGAKPKDTGAKKTRARKRPTPSLTPAKRREKLDRFVGGVIDGFNARGQANEKLGDVRAAQIDYGTAMILDLNREEAVNVYAELAEESVWVASLIDNAMITNVYIRAAIVTISIVFGVMMVRGVIRPDNIPAPLRFLFPSAMFTAPPSDEVVQEAERQAASNGNASGPATPAGKPQQGEQSEAEPEEKPPAKPAAKSKAKSRKGKTSKGASSGS